VLVATVTLTTSPLHSRNFSAGITPPSTRKLGGESLRVTLYEHGGSNWMHPGEATTGSDKKVREQNKKQNKETKKGEGEKRGKKEGN